MGRALLKRAGISVLVLLLHASAAAAAEPESEGPEVAESPYSASANTRTYACDIRSSASQCREYEILNGADASLATIREGCESMGGDFDQAACPGQSALAVCQRIIRDKNQPDTIYDNHYYAGENSRWTPQLVRRVCSDLGGDYREFQ